MEYRFRESVFRKFESALREAVERAPEVAVFDPGQYTVETFSRRLRDAKKSLLKNGWQTSVNVQKLQQIDFVIAERQDRVLTGSTEKIANFEGQQTTFEFGSTPAIRNLKVRSTDLAVINAALTLFTHGELDSLEFPPEARTSIDLLQEKYDILYQAFDNKILVI